MSAPSWSDLGPRVASAIVMIGLGGFAIVLGGPVFVLVVLGVVALMVWEIFTICDLQPERGRLFLPVAFACVLYLCLFQGGAISSLSVFASVVLSAGFGWGLRKDRLLGSLALLAVFWVGYGLVSFREGPGVMMIFWLILVVIASDVMGYFAGRALGGAKFWPSISPKKTWSGTIAGWIGAALVGAGFVLWAGSPAGLIAVSVFTAFAGQMGDIAESALKRRAGVKDSSHLIPGHGGVLDRFDAVAGAVLFVMVLTFFGLMSV